MILTEADWSIDLREALRLEPTNESVKQELKKTENLLIQTQSKQNTVSISCIKYTHQVNEYTQKTTVNSTPSTFASASPQRRRIPIQIVEPTARSSSKAPAKTNAGSALPKLPVPGEHSENDFMKPVSSRSLTSASTPASTKQYSKSPTTDNNHLPTPSSSLLKSNTFKDAKQARESTKPSRAGGGIFRPSGDHTIFDNGEKKGSQPPAGPPPVIVNDISQKTNNLESHLRKLSGKRPSTELSDYHLANSAYDLTSSFSDISRAIPPNFHPRYILGHASTDVRFGGWWSSMHAAVYGDVLKGSAV